MNMKSFWWLVLAFTFLWIWMEWTEFQQVKSIQNAQLAAQHSTEQPFLSVPMANEGVITGGDIPSAVPQVGGLPSLEPSIAQAQRIHVRTDVLDVILDTNGGDIRQVKFLYYGSTEDRDQPFQLMGDTGNRMFIAQSGIAMQPNSLLSAPNHHSVFSVRQNNFTLVEDILYVPMFWEEDGIRVTKTYIFERGSYQIEVRFKVENFTNVDWAGSLYSQIKRNRYDPDDMALMHTFTGPALYDGQAEDRFVKHSFNNLDSSSVTQQTLGGWGAMIQHYFIAAVIPNQATINTLFAKPVANHDEQYLVGVVEPLTHIAAGSSAELSTYLYIGPILQDKLRDIVPGLELTVDYGIFTFMAVPLFWLISFIYSFVGNWGWSIIVLTILIKLVFYKLSATSYRSMARLKKFQPKLKQLKENYGDDKAIFQQKMMKLYKEEKINPLGGCLPILVQMPVFIALFWVLLYSAEMRQAPWILWIQDLSVRDPYFILPVIMGISMWVQQRLNPSMMMDEMQQKVMKMLPFIFTIFFAFFPAGLVLYWVVNSILSVAQQWYITKKIVDGDQK